MDLTVTITTGGKKRVSRETHTYRKIDVQTLEQAEIWFLDLVSPMIEAQMQLTDESEAPKTKKKVKA